MCTLSFVPKDPGYLLVMNRDELFTRDRAALPQKVQFGDLEAVFPRDAEGGTWIALNSDGVALALLNWSKPPQMPKLRSRGQVIPQLITEVTARAVDATLRRIALDGMRPFRLFGVFPGEHCVTQWSWDGSITTAYDSDWQLHHWFSSGLSDDSAEANRGPQFRSALEQADALTIGWLRRLHSSHVPERGPFSICVHRQDAATLSYTEVVVSEAESVMRYRDGSPCASSAFDSELRRPRRQVIATRL